MRYGPYFNMVLYVANMYTHTLVDILLTLIKFLDRNFNNVRGVRIRGSKYHAHSTCTSYLKHIISRGNQEFNTTFLFRVLYYNLGTVWPSRVLRCYYSCKNNWVNFRGRNYQSSRFCRENLFPCKWNNTRGRKYNKISYRNGRAHTHAHTHICIIIYYIHFQYNFGQCRAETIK